MPTQTQSTDKLQRTPQCFTAPLDAFLAGCVAMVGFAALTPPYVIALRCLMFGTSWVLGACRLVGFAALTPPYVIALRCLMFGASWVLGVCRLVGFAALTPPYVIALL